MALKIIVASQIHLRRQQSMNIVSPNDVFGMFSRLIIHISVFSISQIERLYGIQFPHADLGGNQSLGFLTSPHIEESHHVTQCLTAPKKSWPEAL